METVAQVGAWPNRTIMGYETVAERAHLEYCRDRVPFDGHVDADLIEFLDVTWPDVPPVSLLVMKSFSSLSEVRDYVSECGGDIFNFVSEEKRLLVQMLTLPAVLGVTVQDAARLMLSVSRYPELRVKIPAPTLTDKNRQMVRASSMLTELQLGAVKWLVDEGFSPDEVAEILVGKPTGPLSRGMLQSGVHARFLRCDALGLARKQGVPISHVLPFHDLWMTAEEILAAAESCIPLDYVMSMSDGSTVDFATLGIELVR